MKPTVSGACCAAALLAAVAGAASAQDTTRARNLAAACFTCHGTDGRSAGGIPPGLAGMNRSYLLQQMKDFKAGKRAATIMEQQAKGYSDEQIELLASYFSSMKPGAGTAAPAARGGY